MVPGDADGVYLIWSNEHRAWWGSDRAGYVSRLSQAGRYSQADALLVCTHAIPGTADRLGMLPEIPVRLFDVLLMLRGPLGEEYEPGEEAWE